mmetsp:Transcript_4728/g.10519  ORF Transcript_4728/g.10519 Transcript_4728/m.10519 type:complete len:824 (-) Transcript_4728:6-2477(-)
MNVSYGDGTSSHAEAIAAAEKALEDADRERKKAERRVDDLLQELDTARTISEVAQAVYEEKYENLSSLRHFGDVSVSTDLPRAARRISARTPSGAARLEALGLKDSVYRHRLSAGSQQDTPERGNKRELTFAESARYVAEEEERKIKLEEKRRAKLAIIRSERVLTRDSTDPKDNLDVSHHKRIQLYNDSMAASIGDLGLSCNASRSMKWMSSFRRLDPRYQILSFFEDVAQEGVDNIVKAASQPRFEQPALLKLLQRASAFSVWRPTSKDAIRKMMSGEATGKGLEIKGKSAKCGMLSSLVPFVQIYEDQHKERIRECVKDGTMRVFFSTEKARDEAAEVLYDVVEMMMFFVQDAMHILSNPNTTPEEEKLVMKHLQWDGVDLGVIKIDDYARRGAFGVEITERLFWEGFVMMQDCSRPPGSKYDIGRPSEPAFQDMNFKAIRHIPTEPGEPVPVIWQVDHETPMSPRTLVMAYEEKGRVLPVVSDFDCFLVGTRGVRFDQPLAPNQVDLVNWTVSKIESVLDAPPSSDTWTTRWLELLKKEAIKGFYPKMPRFGFGDPKSYSLMECAVDRLRDTGAVRHGAECFNYYFPQDLDEEFLVVCDTLPGNVPWKYVGVKELQKILIHKINDGHTFPLNPKWVLCDPGWKDVYDKLMASDRRNVQDSLKTWFPPESGIREHIERVCAKHPRGFVRHKRDDSSFTGRDSRDAMEFAELELERFVAREMGKRKIRAVVLMLALAKTLPSVKAQDAREKLERGESYRAPVPRHNRQIEQARARASMIVPQSYSPPRRDVSRELPQTYISSPPPRATHAGRRGRSTRNLC